MHNPNGPTITVSSFTQTSSSIYKFPFQENQLTIHLKYPDRYYQSPSILYYRPMTSYIKGTDWVYSICNTTQNFGEYRISAPYNCLLWRVFCLLISLVSPAKPIKLHLNCLNTPNIASVNVPNYNLSITKPGMTRSFR